MSERRTRARVAIAAQLLANGRGANWGYELSRNAGVGPGSMYRFLAELLAKGYLEDEWEDPTKIQGRPPRRCYRLTDEGEHYLRNFVSSAPSARARRVHGAALMPKAAQR